jgi:pyruvate,orthophosphate dikinase
MLLKTLPVYFNEVGATNMIRDDTTEIDSWADDIVLYFLRKQIHVNSSNYNIRLVEEIISSWVYNDRSCLKEVVHPDIYNNVNMELLEAYSNAIRTTFNSLGVLDDSGLNFDKLLALPDSAVESIGGSDNQANEIRRKITLICRIYREIVKKYTLVNRDSITQDTILQLSEDIDRIKTLKKVLLSSETTVPEENLFFKRHIAFGIPSVLGTYHEAKFDALSVILQTENRMAVLFEEIIRESDRLQNDLTNEDFRRWIKCLDIMNELAKVHDMENFQITEVLTVMKSNALHVSQFIDLLRVWQKELTWMVDSVTRRIHATLTEILKSFPRDHAPEYIRRLDTGSNDYIDKATDVIIRNMISSIAGFTEMDRFIEVLIKKCRSRIESWPDALLQMRTGCNANGACNRRQGKEPGLPAEQETACAFSRRL